MMVFLVPLALMTVAFAVQAFVNIRRSRICPKGYAAKAARLAAKASPDGPALIGRLAGDGHALGRVLGRTLARVGKERTPAPSLTEEILREEITDECEALLEKNSQLGVVYTVAPLMGLLGTVFGMISTFREFTAATDPSVKELSAGINVALITTAWGLAIAIPAFLFLALIQRRIAAYERLHLPAEASASLDAIASALADPAEAESEPLEEAS